MKLKFYSIVLILSILSSPILLAQNDFENNAKSVLNNLFELSKTKSYEKAALLIAYEGEDKNRNNNDSFNTADKDEMNQVKRICKKISALIDLSSKYEFGKFSSKKDGEKEIYSMEINFLSGDQKLSTTFNLIKVKNGLLFSNMN